MSVREPDDAARGSDSLCLLCGFQTKLVRVRGKFISAIRFNQASFGLELTDDRIDGLADYYEVVQRHNPVLHLVAPCSAGEFAVRHILESLTLLEFLPRDAGFADVGTGAGLPSIPCLLVRDDLTAVLIESKEKKAGFLYEAAERLGISERAVIVNRQFQEVTEKNFSFVTCRALDKFSEKLPRLLKWSGQRNLLVFGGNSLAEALRKASLKFEKRLMPLSEQRFLFIIYQRWINKSP